MSEITYTDMYEELFKGGYGQLSFEKNSPRGKWLKNNKIWIAKITPIVSSGANIVVCLYPIIYRLQYIYCPIFL